VKETIYIYAKREFLFSPPPHTHTPFIVAPASFDHAFLSGCISAKKLEATINQFGLTIDIKKLIEEADTDGSGEIEYDEFKQMFDT